MSKSTITIILFSVVVLIGIIIGNSWLISVGLIMTFLILSLGSVLIGWNFYIPSINKVVTTRKVVVLTFDDGPNKEVTPQILDLLKKYNCQAVFFCIGSNIKGNESIVKRIIDEGHLIGNHSYSHSTYFDLFPSSKMYEELKQTNEEIYKVTGLKCKLFRPPYGVTNPMLAAAVNKAGFLSIGWNKRSFDTVLKNVSTVVHRITNNMKPGDIILLHDRLLHTPKVLEKYLQLLSKTEFRVERLDKILEIECYEK